MKCIQSRTATVLALAILVVAPRVNAQEKIVAPLPPPPAPAPVASAACPEVVSECAPPCGPCKRVVSPTVENVKHVRYCYDVKEEDYAYTWGAHIPLLTSKCRDHCGQCGSCAEEPDTCHKCGCPHTRKVLIKIIVTEQIPTPKCRVDRVPECNPCAPCGE